MKRGRSAVTSSKVSYAIRCASVVLSGPSLAHPGGNATGFMIYEYNLAAKYLELLKEIAPRVTRVAIIRNAANPAGVAQFGALQNAARVLGVDASPINIRDVREIERSVEA